MGKKKRVPPAGDSSGKALVEKDSRTFQEQGRGSIPSDVLGSYTGSPEDGEHPVQDADDL